MCNQIISKKYFYGNKSSKELDTVNPKLSLVFRKALSLGLIDISILEGMRGKARQNLLFKQNKSRVLWPNSKHNILNDYEFAKAIDAAPYVNGKASKNWRHCIFLAGIIIGIGAIIGVKIRWGGNWDMDGEPITDQDFNDLYHYEIL